MINIYCNTSLCPVYHFHGIATNIHEVLSTSCYQCCCMCRRKSDPTRQDNIFTIHHEDCVAIFWKEEIKQVTPDKFMLMLKMMKPNESHTFPGFSLSIFDITLETDVRICCVLLLIILHSTCSAGQWMKPNTFS